MPPTDRSELLQGTLDMLILKTLEPAPLHGYAIARAIARTSQALLHVPQGSLYPALHRLENKGLLAADWTETGSGREAKVYRLTKKGRARLQDEIADWRRISDAIALILQSA
ncbi:MAG TPA: PadR family transcriptional regulator [Vicinamibacterales bacterium]|jgi:PadR family transcriptional regulator PadR|nr:PadR family transcriptional regulator [Vicinamibacterales bacterium]